MSPLGRVDWDINIFIQKELVKRLRKILKVRKKIGFTEIVRKDPSLASTTLDQIRAEYRRWIYGKDSKPVWLPI